MFIYKCHKTISLYTFINTFHIKRALFSVMCHHITHALYAHTVKPVSINHRKQNLSDS